MLYCRLNETLRHNCMFPNLLWSILGFRGIYLNISSINVKFQGGSHHTQWGFKSKVIKINQRLFHVSVYPLAFTPLRRWSEVRRSSKSGVCLTFRQNLINYGASMLREVRSWRRKLKENVNPWSGFEFCSKISNCRWQNLERFLCKTFVNFLIKHSNTFDVPSTQSPFLSPKMIHKVIYFPEFLMRILGEQKKIVNATRIWRGGIITSTITSPLLSETEANDFKVSLIPGPFNAFTF